MASNVLVETIVGAVPLIGDLFDFAWQANTRNLELIERHYQADLKPRSLRKLWVALVILAVLVATVIATLGVIVFKLLVSAFA